MEFPLLIVSQKLPFALAVGCTAVVKPSDLTPGTTTRLVQILHDEWVPDGVVNPSMAVEMSVAGRRVTPAPT